ncbi:hypothetical protein ACFLV1_01635, partial [Chloroflexota bacterium]
YDYCFTSEAKMTNPYFILSCALIVWSIILGLACWWERIENYKLKKKLKQLEHSSDKVSQSEK